MKDLDIAKLKDVYGNMLTNKQLDVIEQYYELDYSLAEIGENLSITRQAVHDAIRCGVQKLKECETKLGFYKKLSGIEQFLKSGLEKNNIEEKNILITNALEILNGG